MAQTKSPNSGLILKANWFIISRLNVRSHSSFRKVSLKRNSLLSVPLHKDLSHIPGQRRTADALPVCLCSLIIITFSLWPLRTERDATNWSSDKLKALLIGLSVENEEGSCEVTEVSKVEGEASINNRKGKLIFFYEWNLKATWTGRWNMGVTVGLSFVSFICNKWWWCCVQVMSRVCVCVCLIIGERSICLCIFKMNKEHPSACCGAFLLSSTIKKECEKKRLHICVLFILPGESKAGIKYKGTIEVPNLSDENDMEDLDVSFCCAVNPPDDVVEDPCGDVCPVVFVQICVSLNKDEPETPLTNLMKSKGVEKIREALGSYVGFLKTGEWRLPQEEAQCPATPGRRNIILPDWWLVLITSGITFNLVFRRHNITSLTGSVSLSNPQSFIELLKLSDAE